MEFAKLLAYCRRDLPNTMKLLREAVEIESPTYSRPEVDRIARFFAREFRRHCGKVSLLENSTTGAAVIAEFWGAARAAGRRGRVGQHATPGANRPILLIGHHDTVWTKGTLARMPFRIQRGRAYGPGILDMKSGIVQVIAAIRALQALGVEPASSVRFFLNPEEETGSQAFRREIEGESKGSRAVLVLEPAAAGGALKTARKGVGEFRLTVQGQSAHAGIDPAAGVNAINELARQILKVEKMAQPRRGLTLNVGVVEGGTRPNVVPELARATVDVRIPKVEDQALIEKKMFALKAIHPGARLKIEGGINRPPMEQAMTEGLFRTAKMLAGQLGFEVKGATTGGGSDGNLSAALGIPTLDGLGGVGDGAHAVHEHVVIRELPRRTALLAALLATL
ncbi:MAG TPA: M20 family metallopeptidase [Terriglobia bacterium]|nr:M20 family metallopeptidase [Terriglobia bacterium]